MNQEFKKTTSLTNEDLNKIKNREKSYLKTMFKEINPYLFRVCQANGFYQETAEDIISETWAVFFDQIEIFEGRSSLKTYLCGILFNKIREFKRYQGRHIFSDDSESLFEQSFTPEGWWKKDVQDPYNYSANKQTSQWAIDCLENLSEQQKTAFIMREVDDIDSEEICNVLGVNLTHLRVLIYRAKEKLRLCLDGKAQQQT